ncbi:MAG: oxygen-independent coproporphyrinogen III oxidase [Betaproteobacteria bacterium]
MSSAILSIVPASADLPDRDVLSRIEGPGPRYTSYPTADRFSEAFGAADLESALAARRRSDEEGLATPLSLYIHIPFCESVCYYCACNKIITKHHSRAAAYLDALDLEIDLVVDALGAQRTVTQLHLGGGSPTFLADEEIARLMATLRRAFWFEDGAELSIEVDPRTVDTARLAHLRRQGFNRISFGVQDFDPVVQQAVHRVQSFESVHALIADARELGFASINADLIYGLPHQTTETFARTVAQMASLRPDRIALYAYAHLPSRFKPQRRIDAAQLPDATQRVTMLGQAMAGFLARDYVYIGMDHFALPDDSLAIAKRDGQLHRNFQGYSTQPDCDLIGLGVSAIGRVGNRYYQNAKALPAYTEALEAGRLPVERGLALDADDLARRDIIMALMCHGRVDFAAIERQHGLSMRLAFAHDIERLLPMVEDGFVVVADDSIQVTAKGWYVVRAVAMVFDRYVRDKAARERFSRLV